MISIIARATYKRPYSVSGSKFRFALRSRSWSGSGWREWSNSRSKSESYWRSWSKFWSRSRSQSYRTLKFRELRDPIIDPPFGNHKARLVEQERRAVQKAKVPKNRLKTVTVGNVGLYEGLKFEFHGYAHVVVAFSLHERYRVHQPSSSWAVSKRIGVGDFYRWGAIIDDDRYTINRLFSLPVVKN